jgi:hypothetical protein
MTALSDLCYALLKGETVSIRTGFDRFGMTNIPREIGRCVERRFGVSVHKKPTHFVSRYGHHGEYFRYTLLNTPENKEGRKKMKTYVSEQFNRLKK